MRRKRATTSRRRRRAPFVRRRRRSRGGGGFSRGGFTTREMMYATGGTVLGFFVPDFVMRHAPNIPGMQTPTGRIIGKAVIGVGAGMLAKRFLSRSLAGSIAVGALASAAMDFIYQYRGAAGAGAVGPTISTPVGQTTAGDGQNRSLTPSGIRGFIDNESGELLNGFVDDDGNVLDGLGNALGQVEDDQMVEVMDD